MKIWISLFILINLIFISVVPVSAKMSPNTLLLQKPEWDGAIISGKWLNTEFRYQSYDRHDISSIGPTFITQFPNKPNLEVGARVLLMNADYDNYDDKLGLSDIDCWGKYQFYNRSGLLISGGLLLTLPFGSDSIYDKAASGEVNIELFGAARYHVSEILVAIGHLGLRKNNDMDVEINSFRVERDGEVQIELGGGIIYQVQPNINLLAELNIATEPYDEYDNDIELTGGIEYRLQSNFSLRGGLGFGFDDGAPETELICGGVYTF